MTVASIIQGVPMDRGQCPFDPPKLYQELNNSSGWHQVEVLDGRRAWMITNHELARKVLGDNRFSADRSRPGFPFLQQSQKALMRGAPVMVTSDDPVHNEIRRRAAGAFTMKRILEHREYITEIVDEFLDDIIATGPGADFVSSFALKIPSYVIARVLGIPGEDHLHFHELTNQIFTLHLGPEDVEQGRVQLEAYLEDKIREKVDNPDGKLLSQYAEAITNGEMTFEDARAQTRTLLIAGHETTASMLGLGTIYLLQHPELVERIKHGSEKEVGAIVEELLRVLTIMQRGLVRIATEDVEIDGHVIRAGEGIHVALNSANRDSTVFDNPNEVNPDNPNRRHIAFGYGIHQCLGQGLSRLEMTIAFPRVFQRLVGLASAVPLEEIKFKSDTSVYGVHALPITWDIERTK